MCGRFTLRAPAADVANYFDLPEIPLLEPRYNVAPTQPVAVVRADAAGHRRLDRLAWGLVPSWASDPTIGNRLINARAETIAEKPAFRRAFRQRRCLVVADGFYEWQRAGRQKQPYYITAARSGPFALAGLWEQWQRNDLLITSCTIITTEANERVRPLHDRMPVILPPEAWPRWLDPGINDPATVEPLLAPCPTEFLVTFPVSMAVNRPSYDRGDCIEPLVVG
jgi:putative SOS response-associated peptidase YedK